ncbi:hypothetical protein D3C77_310440 [compost metagenome]
MVSSIADRFAQVRGRINKAARAAGRDPASVVLTAVSKTQGDAALDAALAAGQRVFGENRVQEARAHWTARRAALPDLELRSRPSNCSTSSRPWTASAWQSPWPPP